MPKLTRRDFLVLNAASVGALSTGLDVTEALAEHTPEQNTTDTPLQDPSLVQVDFEALMSASDLHYLSPVEGDSSGDGQPIGNGRMGTAVWTTPGSINFQINRVDAFAVNRNHMGFFGSSADHCGACGAITIEVGEEPFGKSDRFHQRLSLYGAESQIQGQGIQARCFVSAVTDVLVLEIEDQRPQPVPLQLTLSVWGKPVEKVEEHVSSFEFVQSSDKQGVTRKFVEADHYCRSVVAFNAVQGKLMEVGAGETSRTFHIKPGPGGKTVLHISSAASMAPKKVDVVANAFALLTETAGKSYEALQSSHRAWWSKFWARTYIALQSADGTAEFMQQVRNLHLYIMASTSRGRLPPKWNDLLFSTNGDERTFGSQYWAWTMEPMYLPLFAAGASDLADPYFNMYTAQLPQCRIAAAQRWNAKGAVFPEISPFDGPRTFPDDVAREYRDILLNTPNRPSLSARASQFGLYDITLIDLALARGYVIAGHYTQTSHIFASGPRIAQHAWWRYRHTGDTQWLRTHAYPLLRDCVEFYRSIVVREADGYYHIARSGQNDAFLGVKDGIADFAAIRGITPLAIRSAEILGVDADLRTQWKDLLTHLAPFTMGSDPESKPLAGSVIADDVWSAGHQGDGQGSPDAFEDVQIYPIVPFEVYTLETKDPEMTRIAKKLVGIMPLYQRLMGGTTGLGTTARTPIAVSRVGRGEDLPKVLCSYYAGFSPPPNGLSPFEAGARSTEHLGIIGTALQEGLLQSIAEFPGAPEVIRVFPAWPKAWNATFALEARGGFLVTASIQKGVIAFVEIVSRRGEPCQIRNPWKAPCVLVEAGKKKQMQSEDLIRFPTKVGHTYRLFHSDPPTPIRIAPPPVTGRTSYALTLENGTTIRGALGKAR